MGRNLPLSVRLVSARSGRLKVESFVKEPMKFLLSVCLMIASSAALADIAGKQCGKFAPTDEVSAPMTIADIERQEMAELSENRKNQIRHSESAVRIRKR